MRYMFLPGAAGAAEFWHPFGAALPAAEKQYLHWPGLGDQPHDAAITGFDDLARMCAARLQPGTVVVAQSMGAIVGLRLALDHAALVERLVLVAPTGGVSLLYEGADWRGDYPQRYPAAAAWAVNDKPVFDDELANLHCPVLVVSGDDDPLSPPQLGRELAARLHGARFKVLTGGTHAMANEHPDRLRVLLEDFLFY